MNAASAGVSAADAEEGRQRVQQSVVTSEWDGPGEVGEKLESMMYEECIPHNSQKIQYRKK